MQAVAKIFRVRQFRQRSNFVLNGTIRLIPELSRTPLPPEGKTDSENSVEHSIPLNSQHDLETEIMKIIISYL